MKVELMSYTPDAEELIAKAYGICTGKDTIPVVNITGLIEKGHVSPIEHAKATFHISDISRACSHQLVRHRLSSFSQRSQRYCAEDWWEPVMPPSIAEQTGEVSAELQFRKAINHVRAIYNDLQDLGIPDEDARFVLPNATPTQLMMTANFREWRHIIGLRGGGGAQWEIRDLVYKIEEMLLLIAPHVFRAAYGEE